MDHAVAFVDWGRWVADCPSPRCTNALELEPGQTEWQCRYPAPGPIGTYGGCGTTAPIDWPADRTAIESRLATLPEAQRTWRPASVTDEAQS